MQTNSILGEYSKHGEGHETTIRPEKITWTTASHPDAVLALQMLFQTYFAAVEDALMLVGDVFTETLYSTAPNANKRLSEYGTSAGTSNERPRVVSPPDRRDTKTEAP